MQTRQPGSARSRRPFDRDTKRLLVAAAISLIGALIGPLQSESVAPPPGGDFSLRGANGPLDTRQFRGKAVVIYFGYTHCPSVCPMSLALIAAAMRTLGDDEVKDVVGLFVSLDPARDDPARCHAYARRFHPRFLGLSGTEEAVRIAASHYRVLYRRRSIDSQLEYAVDHSSFTYVIDRSGRLHSALPHATPPVEIATAIQAALRR